MKNAAQEIIDYCRRLGVKVVVVTKGRAEKEIKNVLGYNVEAIGESRVNEFIRKEHFFPFSLEKHFIGRIQSNKIRKIVKYFDVIQSVDCLKHLKKINTISEEERKIMKVFLQINISHESQKGGCCLDNVDSILVSVKNLENVEICGFMSIHSQSENEDILRNEFRIMKNVYTKYRKIYPGIEYLSMGMSNDFKIAIEEGSTMVRLGRCLFE